MISARAFCRLPDLPISIFFTYAFDPLFFERVPWSDLAIGGRKRVIIAADAECVAEAMLRCSSQIVHLGRSYLLAETSRAGVFHPKLIARLSEKGGRVWVGSGNLTYTGWGGNRELAASWAIGPQEEDGGEWLNDVLERASGTIASTAFADQLKEIRHELPWLTRRNAAPTAPILFCSDGRSLAQQLLERWRGRQFRRVRICTGSTDVNGAFLGWAKQNFGVMQATLYLNIANASFDRQRLEELGMDIRIVPAPSARMIHAKFYWFDGGDGPGAVMGSANCSAAAWFGKNVELVVPYDNPRVGDFKDILSVFDDVSHSASDILTTDPTDPDDDEPSRASNRLVSLRLRPSNLIEANIEPPLPEGATAHLRFTESETRYKLVRRRDDWVARLPDTFRAGMATMFGSVDGESDGVPFQTAPRWVDNDALLERGIRGRDIDANLSALSRERFSARDSQKVIEAIQAVASEVLDPSRHAAAAGQQRTVARSKDKDVGRDTAPPEPVDPASMIRSLREIQQGSHRASEEHNRFNVAQLDGIIALLFEQDIVEDIDLSQDAWSAGDTGGPDVDSPKRQSENEKRPADPDMRDAAAAVRRDLAWFLRELGSKAFAETAVPNQMVQAIAFPLLVCVRAVEAGWLQRSFLASTATKVAEIVFHQRYGAKEPRGLLGKVRTRYVDPDKREEFDAAIGDGTLWIALLAALQATGDEPPELLLPQAAALSTVYASQELLVRSEAAHLSWMLRRLQMQNAQRQVVEKVGALVDAFSALKVLLENLWPTLSGEQKSLRSFQPANALLWHIDWGWCVTDDNPAETVRPGYINVETASSDHPEIAAAIAHLTDVSREISEL